MNNTLSTHQEKQTDLPMLTINGRETRPVVQAGMGVGISNWRLAGTSAQKKAIGTLSAIGHALTPTYRYMLDEAMKIHTKNGKVRLSQEEQWQIFYDVNLLCIQEEVRKARELAGDNGSIYMNVMVATNDYERQVRTSCEAGVDGIVSGAGTPFKLSEILAEYPKIAFVPIFSEAGDVGTFLRRLTRQKKRLPDAIILEDPSRAGGHLGAPSIKAIHNAETTLEISIPKTRKILQDIGLDIPIIAAGGVADGAGLRYVLSLGASGGQMGTRFLATQESGASPEFKQAIVKATAEDIREYTSNTMLPARALNQSGIFNVIENRTAHVRGCVWNCLVKCAFRDGIDVLKNGDHPAQMCIPGALAAATEGNPPEAQKQALYFTGTSAVKIHTLKSVEEIINELAYPQK